MRYIWANNLFGNNAQWVAWHIGKKSWNDKFGSLHYFISVKYLNLRCINRTSFFSLQVSCNATLYGKWTVKKVESLLLFLGFLYHVILLSKSGIWTRDGNPKLTKHHISKWYQTLHRYLPWKLNIFSSKRKYTLTLFCNSDYPTTTELTYV